MSKVLVVEDSKTDSQILIGCLQQMGIEVNVATSSEEALEKLQHQKPDAIILDVVLPGKSGFEFCREIKELPDMSDIPIVMSSTKNTEMDKFWGMKQGADAYLPKPIDQDELTRTLKKLLKA